MEPPTRNSMWRFGYPNPVNFNDNEMWCGGAAVLQANKGKCGVCGDNWADPPPRTHEIGGKYGNKIITRKYTSGQTIDVTVDLTANHKGNFQFKVCRVINSRVEITQECLDKNILSFVLEDGKLTEKFEVKDVTKATEVYNMKIKLPAEIMCKLCVLQWTYTTGNSWGTCEDGTEAMGCGYQETFKNCADVSIFEPVPEDLRSLPDSSIPEKLSPDILYEDVTKEGEPLTPIVVKSQFCAGVGPYKMLGMNEWCQDNCMRYPPNCPQDICRCITSCKAIGRFKKKPGANLYCSDRCNVHSGKECPTDKCRCD